MTARDTARATRRVGVAVSVALVAALAACSSGPDPEPAAEALAAGLSSGDLGAVTIADPGAEVASTELGEILEGMGDRRPAVAVGAIESGEDDTRIAELEFTWDLDDSDQDWTYTATAQLTPADEEWEVTWSPSIVHPDLVAGDRLAVRSEQPPRGEILGAGGAPIVTERPVYRIGIDKTKITAGSSVTESAEQLAELVDVDAAAFAERVEAAGDKAFVEAITLREGPAVPVLSSLELIPGAAAVSDSIPLAPTPDFARPLLGSVGEATAEIVEASEGAVRPGDVVGLSGLQERYDATLRGTAGLTVRRVPADGDPVVLHESEPVPGAPLATTLDPDLQMLAEEILADVGPASAIVAVQPSTGNVLAAASGPGGEGYSTATLGQYAPGSTFKVVTALALLRAGLTAETVLECTDTTTVEGKSFKNYDDYPSGALGEISLRTVVANSCNTALIGQRDAVTQADLAAAAASLGLGVDRDLGAPAFLGEVPAEAGSTEHAASMIGQGKVLASPLAMATVAASIAQGATVVPRIVEQPEPEASPAAVAGTPLTAEEAQQLQSLMRAVVEDGSGDFLADVPGEPVGAKTGTAEYGDESPPRTHGWMIATQGDLAVAVMVEDAESGSKTAGPLLEEFLDPS